MVYRRCKHSYSFEEFLVQKPENTVRTLYLPMENLKYYGALKAYSSKDIIPNYDYCWYSNGYNPQRG